VRGALLDTCLVSELVKPRPDPGVVAWLAEQEEERLFLSAITLGELHKGVARLPDSARRDRLARWLEHDLTRRFEGRILAFDADVAEAWGRIHGAAARQGLTLPLLDSQIAATAQVHGLLVVTRNTPDLERCGAEVVNPWSHE